MIHVLSKILGRKKSGNSDNSSASCSKPKDSQSIWQKATSLRQSLRHSSRAKVAQKTSAEYCNLSSIEKSATLSATPSGVAKSQQPQIRREWGSQRNLARERRSLATKHFAGDELAAAKRSLHSRSLCMSSEWDMDANVEELPVAKHHPRSPRKLTKDSGYETSAQGDPDYANSLSDWLSEEKALDQMGRGKGWTEKKDGQQKEVCSNTGAQEKRLEWNSRHRPLSFSHQEVTTSKHSSHRQLRHSYSQREVRHSPRQASVESLAPAPRKELTSAEPAWPGPAVARSTPLLAQGRGQRASTSSTGSLLQSETDEGTGNMVTRRFKKGSVYDALASTSGLDFSPVVQLKAYNSRREESPPQNPKPEKLWESQPQPQDPAPTPTDPKPAPKCIAAHEKYPSWPTPTAPQASPGSYRSHSWTGQTDYPKEKAGYSRPKKAHQYKISTNQLQPVLERTSEPSKKADGVSQDEYRTQQFDFEAFHTPCRPQCYEDKDYRIHSPPERDVSSASSEAPTRDTNGFLNRYEDALRHQAQYSVPLANWSKQRANHDSQKPTTSQQVPDTPFLDRLRMDSAWHLPPPPPPQHAQPAADIELSSENGTWMGSMDSSQRGCAAPKLGWQGSYSDLSTLSTQLSNRSSLFDSGHSTMPESGRLSPQSSCDSLGDSLGPTRAQVVARHGCPREIVAHSARVQQPERHGSESVLYYGGEEVYRSQASIALEGPKRQDSRKSANSVSSSEDSYPRVRSRGGEDTSGSSSDVSNITCISNYKTNSEMDYRNADDSRPQRNTDRAGYDPPSKSKSMDETSRKFIFPEGDKRQRVSDPELKAIQKQAVMSFYQRMSLAESIKSDKLQPQDSDPPPPYEATRLKVKVPLLPSKYRGPKEPPLLAHPRNSKSVPNLMTLKCQSLDLPPSHPIFKQPGGPKRGSPLAREEVISWDQLPSVLERRREASEKASSLGSDSKDPPDDGSCPSATHYFKSHKSPRKVQLKEVHHSNETASVKVMTPDGVTLVQANPSTNTTRGAPPPHKRRPAPPPPPKQPPKRPPPPPPPATPPPEVTSQVVVLLNGDGGPCEDMKELRIEVKPSQDYTASSLSPLSSCCGDCPSSPELPLPPPPEAREVTVTSDEPLPPPPEPGEVDVPPPRTLDSSSLVYPKNSYMSYRSERKLSRHGFDGKYHRCHHNSASSIDLTSLQDPNPSYSPTSWEQMHNIRQHATTVIFHSESIKQNGHLPKSTSQDSVLEDHQNQNRGEPDVVIDCELENDNSFVDSADSDSASVDHNQNAVKNENGEFVNGNDVNNRINSSTQTTDTPRLQRKYSKTKEELECERLSLDFIHQYGDVTLKNLLVPAPNHKRMCDYVEGLLNLELEKGGHPVQRCRSLGNPMKIENGLRDEKWKNSDKYALFESKISQCMEMNENENVDSEIELKKKREELIISIGKKVETLKSEQAKVREEMLQNESLGQEIFSHLQKGAKSNELEKYSLHVEEMEKIVNLLLSLSGRLAKAENLLENLPKDSNREERRILEAKRNKLQEQHEDARRLKESIDRRSNHVSTFLQRYLTGDQYADYDHFIKMKTKLIVDNRELEEKINLGEEQLAALRNSVVAHMWKSSNSS